MTAESLTFNLILSTLSSLTKNGNRDTIFTSMKYIKSNIKDNKIFRTDL